MTLVVGFRLCQMYRWQQSRRVLCPAVPGDREHGLRGGVEAAAGVKEGTECFFFLLPFFSPLSPSEKSELSPIKAAPAKPFMAVKSP